MVIKEWKSGDMVLKVDYDKCNGDGECVEV